MNLFNIKFWAGSTIVVSAFFVSCGKEDTPPAENIVPTEILTDGLVGAWNFTNGSLADFSNNSRNASTSTASPTTDRQGNANAAMAFSGDDYIVIPYNENFGTVDMTVSLWMKTSSSNETQRLIFLGNIEENRQNFSLNYNVTGSEAADFRIEAPTPLSGGWIYSSTNPGDGAWHHIVGVRNSADKSIKIYVDGALEGTFFWTNFPIIADDNLQLGRSFATSNQFFTGSLDNVRLYNRVLTLAEIETLYQEEE